MRKLVYLLLFFMVIAACSSKKAKNNLLSPANLKSQVFTIDPEKDNVLRTSHAAIIRIKKGTYPAGKQISIEIKEAYTPAEILSAGLNTVTTDGQLLSSGGMIFFEAKAGEEEIKPGFPVAITIPSRDPSPEMKLFEGEENKDGNIAWKEPQPLDTITPSKEASIAAGKALFTSHCASCHSVFKHGTGPKLKGLQYRGPWSNPRNMLNWVNNPALFMSREKDGYTDRLKHQFGSMMAPYPELRLADIVNVLNYINYASAANEEYPATPSTDTASLKKPDDYNNPCGADTIYASIIDTLPEYDTTIAPYVPLNDKDTSNSTDDTIFWDTYTEGYDFSITQNGWYNVDQFLKTGTEGVEKTKLFVDINTQDKMRMNVQLLIPSAKVLQEFYATKGNRYSYYGDENGEIELPIGVRAIVLAYGSKGEKIFYSIAEFDIQTQQTIQLDIKETTEEKLKALLQYKKIDGVELEIIKRERTINPRDCPEGKRTDLSTSINSADIIDIDPKPGAEGKDVPIE